MKYIKLFLFVFVIIGLTQTVFSQSKLSGRVLEIIDGKTAVVQIGTSGKLTVILQYVEIPEAEQPFHAEVKDHLEKILLGKIVSLIPRGIVESSTVARVFLNDTDISQQVLRDGAAWFALPEQNEKSDAETEIYLSNEAQAKAEKRGIWSLKDLKPAWEFRAAKAERERAEEFAKIEDFKKQSQEQRKIKRKLPPPPALFSNFEMWKSGRTAGMWDEMQFYMQDREYDETGLIVNRVPQYNAAFIMTKDVALNLSGANTNQKVVCGVGYISRKEATETKEFFGMGCKSESDKEKFKTSNELTFTMGGKKINPGKAVQLGMQSDKKFKELLIFVLKRDDLVKISTANDVQIKIGNYSGAMPEKFHSMIKNLILESAKEIK